MSAGSAFAILCFVRITLALLLLLVSAAPSWGANISFVPGGPITGFGLSAGENSQDSAMTGVMSSITANGTVDIDAGGTVNLVGSVIGSASDDLTIDAADMTFTHLEDYDNSSSSSAGFSMSPGNLPTLNFGNSSTEISGTTYATLGQGTFTIGGETFVNDQGATLTGDQIAYLTQNPGSTISNTPEGVLGSNHYEMTQENFVENVVLDSGALDVIAGSQDYELIYSLNGEWTPTQQGKFDAAMSDTLGDLFTSGDVSDFLDRAGDNLNPEVSYTGATDKIGSLINGLNDDSISAADLGLPEGTTAEDAVEYLSGLLTGEDGTPLSDEDLSNNLAAMLDPAPSENCWDNPDAACDGVDADGRLFAGGDAIIAEDGPLAGANLNIDAAQTGLDVVEQEFQLDLNLQSIADFSENVQKTTNLVEAILLSDEDVAAVIGDDLASDPDAMDIIRQQVARGMEPEEISDYLVNAFPKQLENRKAHNKAVEQHGEGSKEALWIAGLILAGEDLRVVDGEVHLGVDCDTQGFGDLLAPCAALDNLLDDSVDEDGDLQLVSTDENFDDDRHRYADAQTNDAELYGEILDILVTAADHINTAPGDAGPTKEFSKYFAQCLTGFVAYTGNAQEALNLLGIDSETGYGNSPLSGVLASNGINIKQFGQEIEALGQQSQAALSTIEAFGDEFQAMADNGDITQDEADLLKQTLNDRGSDILLQHISTEFGHSNSGALAGMRWDPTPLEGNECDGPCAFVTELLVGVIPIVGQGADTFMVTQAWKNGDWTGIAASSVGFIPLVGDLGKSGLKSVLRSGDNVASETTTLYRAVSPEEYQDIMETGRFNTGPNSLDCKQFGCDLGEVTDFANTPIGSDAGGIIGVEVPNKFLDNIDTGPNVDPMIFPSGTITIDPDNLDSFNDVIGDPFDALE